MSEDRPRHDDGFEPTIRIDLESRKDDDSDTTRTRKIKAPHTSGGLFEHITGMFRRKGNSLEVVELREQAPHVSLEPPDPESFPPLEEAYERREELAAGGQARLYRGFDLHLRRQVAIKSLRPEQNRADAARKNFVDEAMITAQLDHPAIVPVYSIHRDAENNLHLAMKLVNGRPFQKYLADTIRGYELNGFSAREEQRSLNYRLEVFLSVCDALEYAHNRNIMHCDLKPENIMIGEYHEAYLMDWGLARRIDEPDYDPDSWESPSVITGTPRFLSPEAVRGEHCDVRTDIYAMGLILYEVVALHTAYSGGDHNAIVAKIRRGEMRPVVHRFGYPIPTDMRKIILRAAAWNREKRYQSVEELSSDVRRYIRGEEVRANPDSLFSRLARAGYRHRRLMFSLSFGLLTLGAVATSFAFYDRVAAEKQLMKDTELRHNRERVLNHALAGAIGAGRYFDRQIAKLEYNLYSLTTEALFLLNADLSKTAEGKIYSTDDMKNRLRMPGSLVKSKGFGYDIDLENMVYHVAPGVTPPNLEDRVRRLKLLSPRLLRAIIESRPDSVIKGDNLELLKQRVINSGSPLSSVYMGFSDGLFAVYPGEPAFPEGYDHRKRFWYTERFDGSKDDYSLQWGSPYTSTNNDLVITCTMPMIDTKGRIHGIAGLDVSLRQLIPTLRKLGSNGDFLLGKMLVDADGSIILDIDDKFIDKTKKNYTVVNKQLRLLRYSDPELLERIKAVHNGFLVRAENDRVVAYIFSGLYSVPWHYIEKIDLEMLLRERGVAIPHDYIIKD